MLTKVYTYRTSPDFLSSWKVSAEKLAALCESEEALKTPGNWVVGKPSSVDSISVPICNAMNLLPHIRTTSSCQGHGNSWFFVQFNCSEMSTLHFLVDIFGGGIVATRPDGQKVEFSDWDIEITNRSLIQMRAFENVTFNLSSDSLGKEKDDAIKIEVVTSYVKYIAERAKIYAEQLEDAYERRLNPPKNPPPPMEPPSPENLREHEEAPEIGG